MEGMEKMFVKCVACGRNGARILYNGKFFCKNCTEAFGTCMMCTKSVKCNFENNLSPIPKVVTQTQRQKTPNGYIESTIQIPNPKRIKAMCIEGKCECCLDDPEHPKCMRQFGTCAGYTEFEF